MNKRLTTKNQQLLEKWFKVFRWIGIIPAGLFGFLITTGGVYYVYNYFWNLTNIWIKTPIDFLASLIGGAAFVLLGSYCCSSSRYKGIVSIVLTILISVVVGMYVMYLINYISYFAEFKVDYFGSLLMLFFGSILACFSELGDYFKYIKTQINFDDIDRELDSLKI